MLQTDFLPNPEMFAGCLDCIYVNRIDEIVKSGFVTAHFSAVPKAITCHLGENNKLSSANATIEILPEM